MQQLASRVWPSGWHPGGLGWGLTRHALADSVVVALDEGRDEPIVGFAGRGGDEITHVAQGRDDVADALVTWLLEVDENAPITICDGADALARAVSRAGLEPVGREPWSGMILDVANARDDPRRRVDGYTIRSVRADETAARVDVHRAAWKPSSIPYVDGRVVDPDAESSFTPAAYESVRGAWLYDPSLDLVAVSDDHERGPFGACCIAWFDAATGVCEIEPMGVAPEHRRPRRHTRVHQYAATARLHRLDVCVLRRRVRARGAGNDLRGTRPHVGRGVGVWRPRSDADPAQSDQDLAALQRRGSARRLDLRSSERLV
jgi:hypothetical protein